MPPLRTLPADPRHKCNSMVLPLPQPHARCSQQTYHACSLQTLCPSHSTSWVQHRQCTATAQTQHQHDSAMVPHLRASGQCSRTQAVRGSAGSMGDDDDKFQGVVAKLQQLSFQELQQLYEDGSPDSQAAFSASFLFWLSAQEKQAAGMAQQELANLAAQLVYIKEQADWEVSRRLLPPLASSLAYSNYSTWQAQHDGQRLPQVAPGVSITDLYKAAEREEAKLKQWQSPQQRQTSTLDSFAATSGYKQMAADAMARVRARLSGWADDETFAAGNLNAGEAAAAPGAGSDSSNSLSPAAGKVLQQLLEECCCREERATVLPEAFLPPGMQVTAAGSTSVVRVVTTPQRVLQVICHKLQQLEEGQQQPQQHCLPSGEPLQQVLLELQEDVEEYNKHVYSRLTLRDLYGRA